MIDVLPGREDLARPFNASIDRYDVGRLRFTDCRSDAMLLERSLVRISRDRVRDFAFHVFLEGGVDDLVMRSASPPRRSESPAMATVLVLDLSQPVRMQRHACRVLTIFVPPDQVQEVFPDPQMLHGRTMQSDSPLTCLAVSEIAALSQTIDRLSAVAAETAVTGCARLLLAVFAKQAGLAGNARAAARAAMFGEVRRYIQANLHQADLSPESVLAAQGLSRPTMYRLFQHEGGLGAYIRNQRLRQAAEELIRYPELAVMGIAYGLGFGSASDFTRAFRRAYGMSPQEFREQSWQWPDRMLCG
ncbi:AraC family transcriptional regulator [Achromobacter seleniivolatilans]|uniref:AraC family transcriptional regulator n=1 Tax=Achromobacter seleniivolatilans TaxID=3047478 RepID=A0ABY9M3Q3_9BURK|nr:AraC family transcriptional regulator [Achromobacter sp. R39]WMD21636.1 AraC family transcriptional regulator [Achromobacter sp. R39]